MKGSMRDETLLQLGADMRAAVLRIYATGGKRDACLITRRYLYEMGNILVEMHGAEKAASILYNVADAAAAKLPIADFTLPVEPDEVALAATLAPPAVPTIQVVFRRFIALMNQHYSTFFFGVLVGAWLGQLR